MVMTRLDYENRDDARRESWEDWRRRIFGVSRAEVWAALAREIDARVEKGGWWRGPRVVADLPPWQVTLDVYTESAGETSTTYTRLRAPFVNPSGFRFRIYRKSIFSNLGKFFGMQDIEIGNADFDDAFIIQSNDPPRVRALLCNESLRAMLAAQPRIMFDIRDDDGGVFRARFPAGVDELRFLTLGIVKDIDRLKRLFDLFAETLHELCRLGCAADAPPGVTL
jgi:hypothetical protein